MDSLIKNDIFYVCSLIEYIGRITKNRRADIIAVLGKKELERQLELASVNHCLSIKQVADELIDEFHISEGNFDSVGNSHYDVPSISAIAKDYQRLIVDVMKPEQRVVDVLYDVFQSYISNEISDFNTSVYYSSPEYLKMSYIEGKLLE